MRQRFLAIALGLLVTGCSTHGGVARIRAEHIEYPVSLSQAVFDHHGRIETHPGPGLDHFSFSFRHWTMLFNTVDLSDAERDISRRLEEEIESRNGDAIVNLTVEVGGWDPFHMFLGLLPMSFKITMEGDVVRSPKGYSR